MTQAGRHGRRVRTVAVAGTVVAALALVGLGTASASAWTHSGSRHARPHPSTSGTASPPDATPTPSGTTASGGTASGSSSAGSTGYAPPPANAPFDYQIGEPYTPPAGVRVVSRDHDAAPASGLYNICYVNGFQTQSEAASWWKTNHNDLLLRRAGRLVTDDDWNEIMLDITTDAKRKALATIVDGWIDQCANKRFRAVEIDNLDTFTRAGGALTQAQAVAYAQLLVSYAHGKGLAAAQKNTTELGTTGRDKVGFDFAIAEECAENTECQDYVDVYRDHVIVIEYDSANFKKACSGYGATLSIVRRDRDVTAPGSSTYAYQSC
jgi:Glycoside-hydrolase family GH114